MKTNTAPISANQSVLKNIIDFAAILMTITASIVWNLIGKKPTLVKARSTLDSEIALRKI